MIYKYNYIYYNIKMNDLYIPKYNSEFKKLITEVLSRAKITPKYIDILTQKKNMKLYVQAFTASSANNEKNYEIFEQLGDITANKFIVWYTYRRFPQLFCPEGVKVVARLRINYGSKQTFFEIAEKLGFWNWVSASVEERSTKKKSLLEDVMESFCGVTEFILDNETRQGVGNSIVYDILKNIFDNIDMSLKYEDLYDSKTIIKQFFDNNKRIGTWKYTSERNDKLVNAIIWNIPNGKQTDKTYWKVLGKGTASIKKDAEQRAAKNAIYNLKKSNIYTEPPESKFYKSFCN